MRIELNSGGLLSGIAVQDFQSDFDSLIDRSRRMISSFQAVKNFTYNMNGGIGNLQSAVDQIDARTSNEESKTNGLEGIQRKANSFIELTRKVDEKVHDLVNHNKHEFYEVNPWSRPPQTEEEKKWYEKAGEWICQKGEEIKETFNSIKDAVIDWSHSVADTLSKAWNNAVEWCKEHKQQLIEIAIGAVALTAAVVLTVATGGALAPLFIGVAASTVIGGGVSAYQYYNGNPDGATSLGDAIFRGASKGFMTGSISGLFSAGSSAIVHAKGLSKTATTLLGAGSGGMGSAGSETVHALADGDGISSDEMFEIAISGITGTVMGGHSAYKSYDEMIKVGSSAHVLKANEEFVRTQNDVIIQNAKESMKKGISNSIYNAQEYKKNLIAMNKMLYRSIIRDEIIDAAKSEVDGLVSGWIFNPTTVS